MSDVLLLNGSLEISDVADVALHGKKVKLDPEKVPVLEKSRAALMRFVDLGRVVYGVNTGVGRFKDIVVTRDQSRQLQVNVVRSHAVGVGAELPEDVVRAMLLVRANTLAIGYSGVRPAIITVLIEMLNAGIHPCIPCQGSLGASGDLCPLSHMALVALGEGECIYKGKRTPGGEALKDAGIAPVVLEEKEGVAYINGTTLMVGMGSLLMRRMRNLLYAADVAACMSLEALHGTDRAYDERAHKARGHQSQVDAARRLRRILEGSKMLRNAAGLQIDKDPPVAIQDAYTLRCVPQVHGAIREGMAYIAKALTTELNAVCDNPLVFIDEATGEPDVVSAGNFHGEPVAFPLDHCKIVLADMGNMSERRLSRLVDADSNRGKLPMFLIKDGGLESGFMISQYTAAAVASENKVLAHPATCDSLPSSANVEDHVSMGAHAARQAWDIMENVEKIVGIELLCAAQALDFRTEKGQGCGKGTKIAYDLIRTKVDFVEKDLVLAPLQLECKKLIESGELVDAVRAVCGAE